MTQIYKVFISDKVIFLLSDKKNFFLKKYDSFYHHKHNENLHKIFADFYNSKKSKRLIICSPDIRTLKKAFFSMFHYVHAAGGIVVDEKGKILFIKRLNRWDFPKGKCELNESKKETAIREIKEETGITDITITDKLHCSYHIYYRNKQYVLKKTIWYQCASKNQNTIPQTEEDITEIKWVDIKQAQKMVSSSYKSIIDLFSVFEAKQK